MIFGTGCSAVSIRCITRRTRLRRLRAQRGRVVQISLPIARERWGEEHRRSKWHGELRRVAVIGGMRIPFCRSNTLYADLSNFDMATAALMVALHRFGSRGEHIDEVVGGAVVTHSRDFNLAREAVPEACAFDARRYADSGLRTSLQSALMSGAKIASGEIESAISLGSEYQELRTRADRVLEDSSKRRRARPTEGGAQQDEGVQGAVAKPAGAATRAAHGTFYGSALRAHGGRNGKFRAPNISSRMRATSVPQPMSQVDRLIVPCAGKSFPPDKSSGRHRWKTCDTGVRIRPIPPTAADRRCRDPKTGPRNTIFPCSPISPTASTSAITSSAPSASHRHRRSYCRCAGRR